jgi:hypothetical protein
MQQSMRLPVRGAWTLGLLALRSLAWAETCEFADAPPPDPLDPTELLMTKDYQLGPHSKDSADVLAARLTGPRFNGSRRYLRFNFLLADYYPNEKQALEHSVPEGIVADQPLIITLANGDVVELFAWRNGRSRIMFHQPGELWNTSDQLRITTMTGGQYWLDEDAIADLKGQPAVSLAFTTESGSHLIEIDPRAADRIQFVLGCV